VSSSEKFPEIAIGLDDGSRFSLDSEASLALHSIALHNNVTVPQALAISVVNENFLQGLVEEGGQLLIKNGSVIRRLEYR